VRDREFPRLLVLGNESGILGLVLFGNEPGISALVQVSERDRESPRLRSDIWIRAGNIRAREGFGTRPGISASPERYREPSREYPCSWRFRKETGNLRVSWAVSGVEPGISALVDCQGSLGARVRSRECPCWSTSGADLVQIFFRGPFYTCRYGRDWWDGVRAVRARMPALGAAVYDILFIHILLTTRINDTAGFGGIVTYATTCFLSTHIPIIFSEALSLSTHIPTIFSDAFSLFLYTYHLFGGVIVLLALLLS